MSEADIRAAETREAVARARLQATLKELQARLSPKAIAREGARKVADAGQNAARTGADVARRNPAPAIGAAVAAVLLLGRHRIARLFRRDKPLEPKDQVHD
ncbi:DUF3618 domain-containing protein [Sphingomonas bacterium]|uniref:DUF3618 domain-containing protein n=1 Tax=Sphingomonas bacterium TaxID=1895847 RepID=UPI00157560E2|nr:DUF3618 domain-containing protein [Sphingomonas bacterium]